VERLIETDSAAHPVVWDVGGYVTAPGPSGILVSVGRVPMLPERGGGTSRFLGDRTHA
jgi:hypothetical protein